MAPPPADAQPSNASAAASGGEVEAPKSLESPPPPKDVAEALQQRLEKYQSAMDQAKKEGNSSKARRMGRIVKVSSCLFPIFGKLCPGKQKSKPRVSMSVDSYPCFCNYVNILL